MYNINKDLANIFKKMAAIYEFLDDRFRAMAYQRAAHIIEDLPDDVRNYIVTGKLYTIRGIGPSIASKIEEYVQTGKIQKYEELKKKVPEDFIELIDLPGFGPKTLKRIYEELGISTKEELIKALKDGRIERLEGFGPKKVENMLKGLQMYEISKRRILLWEALQISRYLVDKLKKALKEIHKIEVVGSTRRRKETIGDLDILVTADDENRLKIMDFFTSLEEVSEVLVKGPKKSSVIMKFEGKERQVDLRIFKDEEWGAALQYFTGSKQHNIHLREIAKEKGLKINEYGVFKVDTEEKIAGETEESVYKAVGMEWIPPELREDRGEIEAAMEHKLPKLVELRDIKGDLHVHSTWSDGVVSIKDIVEFVRNKYKYEYIVITDHSKSQRVAHGLDEERLLEEIKEIELINKMAGLDFVKKGIEVDILLDGSLDLSDEVLSKLDWVVASVHSHFSRDNTDRIIKAMESPYVNAIGHPTGRLIGLRDPYPVDMDAVIKAAKETGTALEINAQPRRMDIDEIWVRKAVEEGVKLVISTDSHNLGNFAYMEIGVAIARRGWAEKKDILNTKSWEEIKKFVNAKRKKFGVKV
ncbi:DNA polymerase (family 10) [Persephonella hydrogeniphila]|uniref:DNA polymerase beta n=1 Tax=Persephonella hydrogeniphila TaxID=198703 RepID=A0A285NER7_9AQUI|nr:DNA polymerase/3'-5' exonuclease PolX [Persephonella hydrogeniphila]SNZ07768.1 DNA polymerase (family 10) [Persephonella hydrogeniphila]